MRRLILKSFQSPGDILMMTAAVRDLHAACPGQFETDVRTSADALWLNNPHVTQLKEGAPGIESIKMEYPLIHQSNQRPYHFIHGYPQFLEQHLKLRIPVTRFHGDIHLTAEEKTAPPPGTDTGLTDRFWIVIAGGKYDFTAKWWNPSSYQKVVDHFKGRIQFVQCGEKGHWHPKLSGVVDLVGKTGLRDFVRLMYHAEGVLCPVTFAMHLAAAVETKPGRPKKRPCVVVAGGREPTHWEAYPTHQYISTVGTLSCCAEGGCWKSRCQLVGDGDQKDTRELCEKPVQVTADLRIPQCMEFILPEDVIRRIELYVGVNGRINEATPSIITPPKTARNVNAVAPSPPSNGKPSPNKGPTMNVLIQFNHGLGDAVQLTLVLQHLRKFRPDWEIDVRCLRGKHTALRGFCRKVYHDQEPAPDKSAYKAHYDLGWYECYSVFSDSPSTKACNCLREVFRIAPVPELCGYVIKPEPNDFAVTAVYLESIGCRRENNNRYNAVIFHYQGNTSGHKKNLDHHTANAACKEAIAAGFVPVILDWDRRSPLPDGKTIFCPAVTKGDIWGDFGSGDAARIAALVAQASLFIGIDSGPAKAAATTDTPNLCVWTSHHPLQFHDLTKTHHLVPEDHFLLPPVKNPDGAAYFTKNYDYSTYSKGKMTEKLCEAVRRYLGKSDHVATILQDGLTKFTDFWCHADRVQQDWTIIEDVFVKDCYRLCLLDPAILGNVVDVGAHIGTFARLIKKTNSSARVVCLEVAPENIEPLRRNVESIADAVHACVVGEKTGPVKLLNSFTDVSVSRSTGGSAVVSADVQEAWNGSEYRTEQVVCERITLRQVMDRFQMPHIDLLKLDCEGSEYDILQDAPLDRIRFILGEYHGFDRWEEFRVRVFPSWDYGHMSRAGDMGNFHLRNPFFNPSNTSPPVMTVMAPAKSSPSFAEHTTTAKSRLSTDTINLWYAAGLGDILMSYASKTSESAYVLSLKEQIPDVKLRAVICTVGNCVPDLFAHCPHFTDVSYHTWVEWHEEVRLHESKGHPYLADLNLNLEARQLPFFLSDDEKAVAECLESRRYVGLHLFAGSGERNWFGRIHNTGAFRVIETILDQGFEVVLLGGSSKRQEGNRIAELHECFSCPLPVHNLLDRFSVRLHSYLASRAAALVGTMSCYISLGTRFCRPAFVVLPRFLEYWFHRDDGGVFTDLARQGAVLNFWDSVNTLENELTELTKFLATLNARGKCEKMQLGV